MVMISLTYAARRLRLAPAVSQGWCVVLSLPMQPCCQNANASSARLPMARTIPDPTEYILGAPGARVTYGSVSLFIAVFVLGPMVGSVDVTAEGGGGKASREPRSESSGLMPTTVWRRRENRHSLPRVGGLM